MALLDEPGIPAGHDFEALAVNQAAPAAPSTAARAALWFPALLLVACLPLLCIFSESEFLWTDIAEVADHGLIADSFGSLVAALRHGIEGHYYRPTIFLLHTLNSWLLGDSPDVFRAVNLAIHILNVFLVFRLLQRIGSNSKTAMATAALFAIHPLVLTPLVWVSDRTDLIVLTCSLGFFSTATRYVATKRSWLLVAALAIFVTGLGAKESAAASLIITGVLALGTSPSARFSWLRVLLLQGLAAGLFFVWSAHTTHISALRDNTLSLSQRFALAVYVHLEYSYQLIAPATLTVCDGRPIPPAIALFCGLGLAIMALLGIWLVRMWRRGNLTAIGAAAWCLAFLAPTSGLVALNHVRADRYLYCALPAIVFMGVLAAHAAFGHRTGRQASALKRALFIATYGYFCMSLSWRAPHFSNSEALWTYETHRSNACLEGHAYLGRDAFIHGQLDRANDELRLALAPRTQPTVAFLPTYHSRYYQGLVLFDAGKLNEATAALQFVASSVAPASLRAEAAYSLALVDYVQEAFDSMSQHLDWSIALHPPSRSIADVLLLRSYAALRLSQWAECRQHYERYLQVAPPGQTQGKQKMVNEIVDLLDHRVIH